MFEEYDANYKDQLVKGVIEKVPDKDLSKENVCYLSHHSVLREDRDTTKLRVVFDANAKSTKKAFPLNGHLQLGEYYLPSVFDTLLPFRC